MAQSGAARAAAQPVSPIISNISIAPVANGTIIYYDHWEDGYEADINNPTQPTTQIWGDGNPANGIPPGFATDVINAGNVFILTNNVAVSGGNVTVTTPYQYNGRDKFATTKSIAVSRVDWATDSDSNMTQSTLVYDTNFWGTEYRVPVGTNTASSYTMFEYTAVAVMAGKGGAHVEVDANGDGAYETTGITLTEGQSYLSASTLVQGAGVRSTDNPIQVNFLTGDINSGQYYESRDGALLPTSLWSSDYYTPVSTSTSSGYSTRVFLYNPTASDHDQLGKPGRRCGQDNEHALCARQRQQFLPCGCRGSDAFLSHRRHRLLRLLRDQCCRHQHQRCQ